MLANLLINPRDAVGANGTIRAGVDERELAPGLESAVTRTSVSSRFSRR